MLEFLHSLHGILIHDEGGRGIVSALPEPDLDGLIGEFERAKRIMIVTGFPIITPDGSAICETDGPLGAADMAAAFLALGREVCVVTDASDYRQVEAAVIARAPGATLAMLESGDNEAMRSLVGAFRPTHILSLERPGKAADGHFHNARGVVLDEYLADTDTLYNIAKARGAVAIGIGDGGNELGMGNFEDEVTVMLANGREVAAHQGSDYALVAGVSNWWGWGVAAMLSYLAGRDLLPTDEEETALLRAVINAGGVDGITKRGEMTVDNLTLEANLHVLREVRELTKRALTAPKCGEAGLKGSIYDGV